MKRMLVIFGLWVLLSATALGQDLSCPVKITDVRSIAGDVRLLFRNTSGIEITEYEFVVWFVDSEEQIHFLPVLDRDPTYRRVKAGRNAVAVYPASEMLQSTFSVLNAYILHVAFTGGAVWNDDGSHGCSMAALQE